MTLERSSNFSDTISATNQKNSTNACNSHTAVVQQEDQLQEIEDLLSSVESPLTNIPTSPYDTTSLYSNAMAAFDIDFLNTNNNNNNINENNNISKKKPPSYEECIKVSRSSVASPIFLIFSRPQNSHQSTQNNAESYGYSVNNPFPDNVIQQGGPRSVISSDQGLSPPYSNQSPPYSVQSNMVLSPQGYISKRAGRASVEEVDCSLDFCRFSGSPSPSKALSPARVQALRHVPVQNAAMDNSQSSNSGLANSAMFPQMQMNFEYNQNSNPNGLELAGFCSPSGKSRKLVRVRLDADDAIPSRSSLCSLAVSVQ
jgi:hypothetical protein